MRVSWSPLRLQRGSRFLVAPDRVCGVKGETSGNYFEVLEILPDCDQDTLLIQVKPQGPACHRNTETCFESHEKDSVLKDTPGINSALSDSIQDGLNLEFFSELEEVIAEKIQGRGSELLCS